MAQETEDKTKRKSRHGEKAATWLLTGLLILGLGGFGANNFAQQITSVGKVGDTPIPAQDYARTLQTQISALSRQFGTNLTKAEAFEKGAEAQALATVLTRAAMDEAVRLSDLSVGDATVAAELVKQSTFTGASGGFDREVYRDTLKRSGWKETEYEESLRRDVARALLQGAISGGFMAPASATQTLYDWIGERRSLEMIRLNQDNLPTPLAEPTPADLKAFYDANLARFTRPDAKRLSVVALTPDMLLAEQTVDDSVLRGLYDARIDEFVTPERRLLERLVYPDEAAAKAAQERIAAGSTFEAEVEIRGLSMLAVDMGDVSQAELGAPGADIFAAEVGSIVLGDTDLGPALFRVNGILAGENVTFEQARTDLANEIKFDNARREINDKLDGIDDLLAGGAALSDLVSQMGMQQSEVIYVPGQQNSESITGYQAFRQAADKIQKGDFSESILLDDGGVLAMEVVEDLPAAPLPFDEIQDQVSQAWRENALQTALSQYASDLKEKARAGTALSELGTVENLNLISRDGPAASAPRALLDEAFDMDAQELRIIEDGDFIALVRVSEIVSADNTTPEAEMLKSAIDAQFSSNFETDALRAFSDAIGAQVGISLDQTAITTVNTSIP